jgi:hypothetical protein
MDEILEEHHETVIGVKVHNGDSMVVAEQAEIASTLGLGGYPNGNVDRKRILAARSLSADVIGLLQLNRLLQKLQKLVLICTMK